MRNWHLIIPAIAVAVWIISSLMRGAEEQRTRRPRPKADADEPPNPERPRRNANEIDRFLQEVQRRRQEGEGRRPEPVATRDIPQAIPVEPILIPETPRRPRPKQRAASERPNRRSAIDPVVLALAEPVPTTPAPVGTSWQPPAQLAASPAPAPRVAMGTPASQGNAATRQLLDLLRSPQSLRVAFLLREVLDQPVSIRGRERL